MSNWDELITVDWDEQERRWRVASRSSVDQPWTSYEGAEAELAELLALAHDVATGGD